MIWLTRLSDKHLIALYRGGWKRCGLAMRHPKVVIEIRAEVKRRGL